jgi:5-(hydroxymethyl)furfural/furfural oxidase
VLAARLSERAATRVALVEAGPDLRDDTIPARLAAAYPGRASVDRSWLWPGLDAVRGAQRSNRPGVPRAYEQARILGGGSSINGLCANRGSPYDFDEWERLGAAGWGWNSVLPLFRKLERDLDIDGPLHGKTGPLPIQHHRRTDFSGFARAAERAFGAMGFAAHDDQNGEWIDGIFPVAANLDESGHRASAAIAYLTPEVRRRANLVILTDTTVEQLIFDGGRTHAVRLRSAQASGVVEAEKLILSAGALATPLLLMRSGIGPAAHLREHGIDVRADRPGVGENLQEHPAIGVSGFLADGAGLGGGEGHHLQAMLRYSSGLPGTPPGDMHVSVSSRSGWHAVGRRIGSITAWVNKSYSRGTIRLPVSPGQRADIDFRMLSDPRDMERLKAGFRLVARAMSAAPMAAAVLDSFPSGYSARIGKLLRPTLVNGAMMAVAAPLMAANAAVRRRVLAFAVECKETAARLAADDDLLEAHLRRQVNGVWHACGSCRMGDPADPLAVTDPAGRVLGVEGLHVCDASLMPTIPCANLNVPVLMLAEKIAVACATR